MIRKLLLGLVAIAPLLLQAQWRNVGKLNTIRNGHAAARLMDGRVLVCGGYNIGSSSNKATAEIYDPAIDLWSNTDSMSAVRFQHTATLLNDGKVLVTGGWDGGTNNWKSTELFDPSSATWSMGNPMFVGRSGHTATKLMDGKVLMVGGYDGNINQDTVSIYDPATGQFTMTGKLNQGRAYHTATLLQNGKVLVTGGYNPNFNFQMTSAELFDPASGQWTLLADTLTQGRDYHSALLLPDGKVLITGGREFVGNGYIGIRKATLFDPSSNTFTNLPDMPYGKSYHQSALLPDGRALLIAGVDSSGNLGLDPTITFGYDIASQQWLSGPMYQMNIDGRYAGQAVVLDNNQVLFAGGDLKTCEIFGAAPAVAFSYNFMDDTTASFTSLTTGANSILWNFGDGNTATDSVVAHTFAEGNYNVCLEASNQFGSDSSCQTINVTVLTGLTYSPEPVDILLFPNPANDVVTVDLRRKKEATIQVQLVTVEGQVLYTKQVQNVRYFTVPLEDLAAGTYLLHLSSSRSVSNHLLFHQP